MQSFSPINALQATRRAETVQSQNNLLPTTPKAYPTKKIAKTNSSRVANTPLGRLKNYLKRIGLALLGLPEQKPTTQNSRTVKSSGSQQERSNLAYDPTIGKWASQPEFKQLIEEIQNSERSKSDALNIISNPLPQAANQTSSPL